MKKESNGTTIVKKFHEVTRVGIYYIAGNVYYCINIYRQISFCFKP